MKSVIVVAERLRRHPSSALLAMQLLALVLYPLLELHPRGHILFTGFGLIVLGVALLMVRKSPADTWFGMALALLVVGLSTWNLLEPRLGLTLAIAVAESAFYFYAAASLMRYMLEDQHASRDELYAAAATFTVLAWAFAHLFVACQALVPGSFGALQRPEAARTWMELLFLSFTTLSGVGIGDIIPLKPLARGLVMLCEFAGVMYMALIVSRLVGLVTARRIGGAA